MGIWGIMIIVMVASLIIQQMLQSRFEKYSKVGTANGMSGAEVAQKMLQENGIYDVKVVPARGMLTDHYNPQTKTVALSEGVYASSCSSRMWPCSAACTRICSIKNAFSTCPCSKFRF